jgi:hypothetical protein
MSTLKTNTIQHLTSGFNNVVQFVDGAGTQNGRLARVWVNFNGTGTVAIRASFNVSSITDNGTGNYTVNFSNALSDGNYAYAYAGNWLQWDINSNTSSAHGVMSINTGGTATDSQNICVSIFR